MTDLVLTAILVGAAVTFVLEILVSILVFLDKVTINKWFSLPLSFLGVLALYRDLSLDFFVTVPAATFFSLALLKFLNRPQVEYRRVPRI